jgi:hypothetical protein
MADVVTVEQRDGVTEFPFRLVTPEGEIPLTRDEAVKLMFNLMQVIKETLK